MTPISRLLLAASCGVTAWPGLALAQSATPSPTTDLGRVEIRSNRNIDTEVRRESTASKIVIGREEIEKQGDATLSEVLKRLPGVTIGGAPGRGGAIRMRGLGNGYTQILLDGERMPPGFSVDSLTPEQVEKIEILRSPTAETGARAIAGTINIVLREGQKASPDDLKITRSQEHGQDSSQVNWVHNLKTEPVTGTFTVSAMDNYRADASTIVTDSSQTTDRVRESTSLGHRQAIHANARLQWKGEQGRSLTLMPFVMASDWNSQLNARVTTLESPLVSDSILSQTHSRFSMGRLNGQWSARLSADDRLELRFGLGESRYDYRMDQTGASGVLSGSGQPLLRNGFETQNFVDTSGSLNGKWTRALDNGYQIVSGVELEQVQRDEKGNAASSEDAGNLNAKTRRWAAYTQDEFKINANWSAYGGLRYESILTEGTVNGVLKRNESSIWTPLLHAVWKPDAQKRDQVRMSLTRSYKTPTLFNLMARYVPSLGENTWTQPDRTGNPDLKPELATGVDVAFERYLDQGGLLSANLFHRNITNLIRYTTAYNSATQRYISSPANVGDAYTQGVELEAKFRLNQWMADALPVDIRANTSFFHSQVKDVPGPNNRLDQQPSMTANLGADYRMRSLPLTLGGNLNWNPDYSTQRTEQQLNYQGVKRVVDVYGLWRFSAVTALRLTVSNLVPRDYQTGSTFVNGAFREWAQTTDRNWRNLQLRLEMKI
ncbi:TonB-dependent siderophore receptor [Limnohabitans sp. DM1]|uniref:TonB-dependent receptor plug domain-containing protein n=1 Tax=Limnohabitans sp. DM1 TaxID=1597955 RepID=UPI001E2B2588|nr:TonB-dependent receptor [Limnohabitans sp. DM1]